MEITVRRHVHGPAILPVPPPPLTWSNALKQGAAHVRTCVHESEYQISESVIGHRVIGWFCSPNLVRFSRTGTKMIVSNQDPNPPRFCWSPISRLSLPLPFLPPPLPCPSLCVETDPGGTQGMAGGSDIDTNKTVSKGRRWVLRSPGRTPTTKAGDKAKTPANRAPSPPHGPSGPPGQQEQQPPAQQQEASPLNESSQGWSSKKNSQKAGAPRADECLADAGEVSAGKFDSPAGALRKRSSSPLSRIRNKMPVPSASLMKRFRRKSPNVDGSCKTTQAHDARRSPKGRTTTNCSIDTTGQDVELARFSGDGGEKAAEDALTSSIENDGRLKVLLSEPCTAESDETQSSHSDSSAQQYHASNDADRRGNDKLLEEGMQPEFVIEREASLAHTTRGVGEDAIPAVKAGTQPPRIAFIGVFLNGVAVALASYAPFGGVDARISLIKSVRMLFIPCGRKKQQHVCSPRSTVCCLCPLLGRERLWFILCFRRAEVMGGESDPSLECEGAPHIVTFQIRMRLSVCLPRLHCR